MRNQNAFRGGAYSLTISVVVLAILLVLNIFVSALPAAVTRYDISASKLYSITSNTKAVVNALEQDVTIYWVVQSGQEDSTDTYSADDVYFTQRSGKNLPLDTSKVESYLRSITNLNPVNYVSYNVTDEELQTYGLDAPELTITVDYTTEGEDGEEIADTFVLYVSPDPEDVKAAEEAEDEDQEAEISAYVRVGESQIVYKISSSSYKTLAAMSYNDLRHPEVIWADFSDVQQIDISLEGNSYTLISEKDGEEHIWAYQDEELEIADLQSTLEALAADEFTDEQPTQKEEIGLTIHLGNEYFPQIEIKLYRYDGSRCLAVVDGESVSLVNRTAVVNLIEAVHAIVLD